MSEDINYLGIACRPFIIVIFHVNSQYCLPGSSSRFQRDILLVIQTHICGSSGHMARPINPLSQRGACAHS